MNGPLSQLYGGFLGSQSMYGQQPWQRAAQEQAIANRFRFSAERMGTSGVGGLGQMERLGTLSNVFSSMGPTYQGSASLARMGAGSIAAGPMPMQKEAQAPWWQGIQTFQFPQTGMRAF